MSKMMFMRDLRKYARQTNIRIFLGFLILLIVVGGGLIYTFWGLKAALLGLGCIFFGFTLLAILFLILWVMEWFVHKDEDL